MTKIDVDPSLRGQVTKAVGELLDKGFTPQQAGFLISLTETGSDGKLVFPTDLTNLIAAQWDTLITRFPDLENDFMNYAWRGGQTNIKWNGDNL